MTPRSSSSCRQCFHRTGDDSWADSRLAHSLPSWCGRASTLATTGTSVSRGSALGDRQPQLVAGRRHERGVERARHRQRHHLLGAELLGVDGGGGDALRRPGDDDLAGGVVVGHPHVGVGAPAGDVDLVVVEAEHGGHRPRLGQPGLVHGVGAGDHEAHAVVEAERAGGGQRGVLAQAVPGAEAGLDAEALDGVEDHQAGDERGQLGVAGVAQDSRRRRRGARRRRRARRSRWPPRPAPSSRGRPTADPCRVAASPDPGT